MSHEAKNGMRPIRMPKAQLLVGAGPTIAAVEQATVAVTNAVRGHSVDTRNDATQAIVNKMASGIIT